jgi:translation initiation factor 1 (eIF-1/SUI1)
VHQLANDIKSLLASLKSFCACSVQAKESVSKLSSVQI